MGKIKNAIRKITNNQKPFYFETTNPGFFPHSKKAKVFWVGVKENIILNNIVKKLDETNKMNNQWYMSQIQFLAQYLKEKHADNYVFEKMKDVEGFINLDETQENYNIELSNKRAGSVANYIRSLNIIGFRNVAFDGMGSKLPIATNLTSEGRSKNRRVEIIIKYKPGTR